MVAKVKTTSHIITITVRTRSLVISLAHRYEGRRRDMNAILSIILKNFQARSESVCSLMMNPLKGENTMASRLAMMKPLMIDNSSATLPLMIGVLKSSAITFCDVLI
jgi:hypothetical protein